MTAVAVAGGPRRLARALVPLPSAALGGAEAMTAVLARHLAAAGMELELAIEPALRPGLAAMLGPGMPADAASAAPLGWREAETAAQNIRRQAAVAAARVLTLRPDVAVLPLPWPTHGLGVLRALHEAPGRGGGGVPVLAVAHLAPPEPEPDMAEAVAAVPRAALLREGVAWAAVSAPVAARVEAALGLPPGRVRVVPNGVPVPPRAAPEARAAARRERRGALDLPPDAPLFVFAGRLEPKKGADLLPGLALALRERLPGATVAALGEGPMRAALAAHKAATGDAAAADDAAGTGARKAAARDAAAEDAAGGDAAVRTADAGYAPAAAAAADAAPLRLLGQVRDVGEWLLAADALLLPSRLEGCPLVFLEAAARLCPVVAAAAALEAFGDAAWDVAAVAPDDMVSAFADQVVATLTGPPAARRLRVEAAHLHAAAWDEAAMLRRYDGLLRAAAAAAAAP